MREFLTGVQHIGLPVKDFEKSCRFYETLGFENIYETKQPNDGRVALYRLGNLEMEIYEAADTAARDGAIDHIAIDCKDIDGAYKSVKASGLPVVSDGIESLPYWENGIKFFHVRGPAGEKVEFCQKI